MKLSVWLFFIVLALVVTGCAPKVYHPPTLSALLADGSTRAEADIVKEANKIDLNSTPGKILGRNFDWRDGREISWFEDNKIAFVKPPQKKDGKSEYLVYDIVSKEVYPLEDEYITSKIDENSANTHVVFANVTDKKKSVGGQILGALFSAATCADYDAKFQSTITGIDGEGDFSFFKIKRMKGTKVKSSFLGSTCSWSVESVRCAFQTEKSIDVTGEKIPCFAGDYAFMTEDNKFLVTGNYIYDLAKREVVGESIISQYKSKPPVLANYVYSSKLDKLAVLYATPNDYYIEVVDIHLDDLLEKAQDGNGIRGDGVEHPIKVYPRVLTTGFTRYYGNLTAWSDRFEFKTIKGVEVIPYSQIDEIDTGLMSKKVSIEYGDKDLSFIPASFKTCGLESENEVAAELKSVCGKL